MIEKIAIGVFGFALGCWVMNLFWWRFNDKMWANVKEVADASAREERLSQGQGRN